MAIKIHIQNIIMDDQSIEAAKIPSTFMLKMIKAMNGNEIIILPIVFLIILNFRGFWSGIFSDFNPYLGFIY